MQDAVSDSNGHATMTNMYSDEWQYLGMSMSQTLTIRHNLENRKAAKEMQNMTPAI
jgi:hypothetical protein